MLSKVGDWMAGWFCSPQARSFANLELVSGIATDKLGDMRVPIEERQKVVCQMLMKNNVVYPEQELLCGKKKDEPKKKEQVKRAHESKLKAFIKRSSEPLLILQNTQHNQVVKEKVN